MDKSGSGIFKNGLPYAPDLRRLDEAFPNPEEERIITHTELEEILNVSRKEPRYRGVTRSWRHLLFNTRNIDSAPVSGVGFKILPPHERQTESEREARLGFRRFHRTFKRMASIPHERLDAKGQQRHDHEMMVMSRLNTTVREARKAVAIDIAPIQSLPKPKLVKNG